MAKASCYVTKKMMKLLLRVEPCREEEVAREEVT